MHIRNILQPPQHPAAEETLETLVTGGAFKLERIVSSGQRTPPGEWYDQDCDEWVVLLSGAAEMRIEGKQEGVRLGPGEAIHLPAHQRHRVEWTHPQQPTIWLALHFQKQR